MASAIMEFEAEDGEGHRRPRERTLSSMSQQSSQGSKFPLMTSDSGLYTCSSSNSEYLESDSDSYLLRAGAVTDDALQLALHEAQRLRSELERLSKSEQWYKQELRHQKSSRLEDLERIYTQERKFMQENQRLQKECVRLYEKCSEFERELEKQRQVIQVDRAHPDRQLDAGVIVPEFEVQQQSALLKDQQLVIGVLRKQKKALLDDLRSLTEDKDEKVMEMQRLLADLEFDNKQITKKCTALSKERSNLESTLRQKDSKLTTALDDKLNLQKSLVDLREQLHLQERLVGLKENEIVQIQDNFRSKMQNEQDLDEVHRLSMSYHEEIIKKSLEIKTLKTQLSDVQHEIENLQELQEQNDQQQRLIEQLHFSLDACKLELQEIKQSDIIKSAQIEELQKESEKLMQDRVERCVQEQKQQKELAQTCQELQRTKEQYAFVQEQYKETQFKLELLQIDQGKLQFEKENDQQEISILREKLTEYLQQTTVLSERMQKMEKDLMKAVQANATLKQDFEEVQHELNNVRRQNSTESEERFRRDFVELSQQCARLQSNLDVHKSINQAESNMVSFSEEVTPQSLTKNCNQCPSATSSSSDDELTALFCRLQENTDLFRCLFKDKDDTIIAVSSAQQSNDGMEKLVNENEILKKKMMYIENEASILQLKQNLSDMTHKSVITENLLAKQKQKIKELQEKLLKNDAKLYKIERQVHINQAENSTSELQRENEQLKENLKREQKHKTELKAQLSQVSDNVTQLRCKLEEISSKQMTQSHKGVQCDIESPAEVEKLKGQLLELQEKQSLHIEKESQRKDERIQLLYKLADMQNSKIQCIQDSQKDWEDMLQSLNAVQAMEEETRKELELKRRELEDLNHVFGKQNEELRKLEELTVLIENKTRQERHKLKETFQREMGEMRHEMLECRRDAQEQRTLNLELQKRHEQIQQNYAGDYASDATEYKKEIRCLKSKVEQSLSDKDDLLEYIRELEEQLKDIKNHQRQALIIPQLTAPNATDVEDSQTDLIAVKSNISEDHLRILTKVLEAEYNRKMQRYDQHIHSLLSNVKALKKSLRLNEEKTALLDEEQSRTLEEVKELQRTKRKYEDMRFKYEQSQYTIEELKETLALERKKFESSDVGKSSQDQITTYEVSNLIDDYKKLIQQSAALTKRPTTCVVLDLIQRSNQCVPKLHKIESNLVDLRSDLQNFLSSYTQKVPASALISAASLTVPPSLMDELRAASEGY